jgi:hypothetical protein
MPLWALLYSRAPVPSPVRTRTFTSYTTPIHPAGFSDRASLLSLRARLPGSSVPLLPVAELRPLEAILVAVLCKLLAGPYRRAAAPRWLVP